MYNPFAGIPWSAPEKKNSQQKKSSKYDYNKALIDLEKLISTKPGSTPYFNPTGLNTVVKANAGKQTTVKKKDKKNNTISRAGAATPQNKTITPSRSITRRADTSTASAAATTTPAATTAPAATDLNSKTDTAGQWSKYSVGVVYHKDIVYPSSVDEKYITSDKQQPTALDGFNMQDYTRAKLKVITRENDMPVMRSFEFLIGPSQMGESHTNLVNPIKTGGGYFILRAGSDLPRLSISGYLLESSVIDERRLFLEEYYKKYMIDKVNAFHEYFNESVLYIDLMGYQYQCILQGMELNRSMQSMFTFQYTMQLIILDQKPLSKTLKPTMLDGQVALRTGKYDKLVFAKGLTSLLKSTSINTKGLARAAASVLKHKTS